MGDVEAGSAQRITRGTVSPENPDKADQVARTVVSAGDTRGFFRRKEQATPYIGRATLHPNVE